MRIRHFCFLILFFFLAGSRTSAQLFSRKINQWKENKYDGLWISWSDSLKKKVESKGHYRGGLEIRTWKYFYEDGTLRRRERYARNGIVTTYFYPNGKRKSRGRAIVAYDAEFLHYYYQGDWKYYNEHGKLTQVITYEQGAEISMKTFPDFRRD